MKQDSKKKILFVHGITEIGGAERELLGVLENLPRYGYYPVVACPGDGPLVEELLRRGIPRKEAMFVPWRKLWGYLQRAAAIRGLRQVIEMEQPSLLHVNDIWWVPQTLRARAGSGGSLIPLVAHVRQGIESRKVRLYELDQADLVIGSRYVPGGRTPDWGLSRRLISGFGNVFARTLLRLPVRDCTAGFKCYRRCVLEAFDLDSIRLEGYAFQIETVCQSVRKGFRIKEVPIVFPDRKVGTSKMSKAIVAEAFTYVIRRRLGGAAHGAGRAPASGVVGSEERPRNARV